MKMLDLIFKKRNGEVLSKEEIEFFVEGITKGEIPDYQISAFLMAIYFSKLNVEETVNLTMAMANSGLTLDLSSIDGTKFDKHSTGGVGDKCTLIVAPLAASLGLKMAKLSGRGLGFTGGTLDKLESIVGFSTDISENKFLAQLDKINLVLGGQTKDLAPADKILYALRDVTATVDQESLIASSVMSKKIAGGADKILLDITCGAGAFMKSVEKAKQLAATMVRIGQVVQREVRCLITDMNQPLGRAVGNRLEIEEACEVLQNRGPEDVRELCKAMVVELLLMNDESHDRAYYEQLVTEKLANGEAYHKFLRWIEEQGGQIENNQPLYKTESIKKKSITSPCDAYIKELRADKVGLAVQALGGGRFKKDDQIKFGVGIVFQKKVGDFVKQGQVIADIYYDDEERFNNSLSLFNESLHLSFDRVEEPALIIAKVDHSNLASN